MNRTFWSAIVVLAVVLALLLVELVTTPAPWHVLAFSGTSLLLGILLAVKYWTPTRSDGLPRYFLANRTSKNETAAP